MRNLPTGTVTLVFTDIEGSTRLLQALGRDRYVRALEQHRRLLRDAFTRHGGVEVEMQGDSFFFAFAGASEAVRAAAEAQRALAEHAWEAEPLRARIGIHTGEPLLNDGLYAGLDVHRAARVMSAGHGGQVLVSQTTRELLEDDFDLRDVGERRLKDLSRPLRLFQLGNEEFPPLHTLDMTNLPIAAGPLLGRDGELEEALSLLRNGTRLLTVTGPGGTGKTRFALQLAAELVDAFTDGVFWVPLSGIDDADLVVPTISQTVGARGDLGTHLRNKHVLVLLDNAEHLLSSAPQLAELLAVSSQPRFLVTSRAPLHLVAEQEFPLEPLPPADAATLFLERARAVGRKLDRDPTIAAICARLDGLPLALELAAARTKVLSPATLLERLDHALPLLVGGARDAPERQRTLRATIEWSYELLDAEAQRLLARLSVLETNFSLDAAESVCDANVESIFALVDNSLLKPLAQSRFLILETIRQFAAEHLDPSEDAELRRRHAGYFLELATRAEPHLRGRDQREWLDLLELEIDQLRSALAFLWMSDDGERLWRLASALVHFWFVRGYLSEGRIWLERALDRTPTDDALRARTLGDVGFLSAVQGAVEAARNFAHEGLSAARRHGESESEAACLQVLAIVAHMEGAHDEAYALASQSLEIRRTLGDRRAVAVAAGTLATMAAEQRKYQEARTLFEESAAIFGELGEHEGMSFGLASLAELSIREGRMDVAAPLLISGLTHAVEAQHQLGIMYCFEGLAAVLCRDAPERAASLLGAADAIGKRVGAFRSGQDLDMLAMTASTCGDRLGEHRFQLAWDEGAAMSLDQAVEIAVRSVD